MDGYHVLVDLLGQPTLKHDAVQFVRDALWRHLTEGRAWSRQEGIWVGYFALSFVSIVAFITFNLLTILHVVVG
jgi:hypothetical protein